MIRRLSLIAAVLLSACQQTAADARPARPALWRLADRDTTIYLFGSIHLLPKDMSWHTPALNTAIAKSQGLILETVLDKNPAAMASLMQQIGMSPDLPPVIDRVPADKRQLVEAAAKKAGVPLQILDKFETWAVALTLASAGLRDIGLSTDYGVEDTLRKSFADAGKSVAGLETPAEQLGYFDTLPEATQREFLVGVLEDNQNATKEFAKMIRAWASGDTAMIAATFDDELKSSGPLADALLVKRNQRWAAWLANRMKQPGTVFVAVGAGHLAGGNSVQTMLAKRGLRDWRVQ
ncbi:MAG TPA: TraB/GumN family protein [Sphingomonas sp.]|nr:TraB/GumN family protein [Sphingomonas sp.]